MKVSIYLENQKWNYFIVLQCRYMCVYFVQKIIVDNYLIHFTRLYSVLLYEYMKH